MLKYKINRFIYNILFKKVDLFSIETKVVFDALRKNYKKIFLSKLFYIPNTVFKKYEKDLSDLDKYKLIDIKTKGNTSIFCDDKNLKKEKIILTVGAPGAEAKATEILLLSFLAINNSDWKLILVGPIFNEFDKFTDIQLKRYPHLKNNILITGLISDRDSLEELYSKSSIFCLPSRWESFGISMIEAASNSCFIIASDLASSKEITNNWEFGIKIRPANLEDLIQALEFSTHPKNFEYIIKKGKLAKDYFNMSYSPSIVISDLYKSLF